MAYLDGKVAIVTGAAQGLGAAFATRLAQEGADVAIMDLKPEVAQVGAELRRLGHRVVVRQGDVSKREDCEALVRDAAAELGGVDVLVNNAGKWTRSLVTDPWEKALADFDEIFDTNMKGAMMMGRLCVQEMLKRGGGDIVNVSTYYVLPARSEGTNSPATDCYNASKWAMNGFTGPWALSLAEKNIRVNGIAMGATDTAMLRGLFKPNDPPADTVKGWMRPEQIADLMIQLMKDGRTGENVGAWAGYPVELGPRQRMDSLLRWRPDFTGEPLRMFGAPPWDDVPPMRNVSFAGPARK
ncbi:MAG: SDR family NAD(P)-dependent oxidoreductase [Dehalococcoidia bacterium]